MTPDGDPRLDAEVLARIHAFAGSEADPESSAELRARTLELAKSRPSPSRASLRLRRWFGVALLILLPVALFWFWGGVRAAPRSSELLAKTAAGAAVIALVASVVAFSRGGSMLGRSRRVLLAVVVLTPVALLSWKVAITASHPGMLAEWAGRPGLRCLALSCLLSLVPLLGALFFLRRSDPVHPMLRGMAIGAAIASSSWVLVDLWCPVAHLSHLLLGHVVPLLFAVGVGALLGRRLLAPRRL
jgi:hypothetical protein